MVVTEASRLVGGEENTIVRLSDQHFSADDPAADEFAVIRVTDHTEFKLSDPFCVWNQ